MTYIHFKENLHSANSNQMGRTPPLNRLHKTQLIDTVLRESQQYGRFGMLTVQRFRLYIFHA